MFQTLNEATAKPVVWSSYTAELLWTDPHISKQMLTYHLNPELNVSSRPFDFIDESVDWLISEWGLNEHSSIIDFGCGPGLYTYRLKSKGAGHVAGIDFSKNSLNYAIQQAKAADLNIEYHQSNYLNYNDTRKFDLITLVMCDFCALNPVQRSCLLDKFRTMLKSDGIIALDVFTSARFSKQAESVNLIKNHMNGFWSDNEYWCVHSSFAYQTDQVWLDKFVIIEEGRSRTVYNWLQHFSIDTMQNELEKHGLKIQSVYRDLRGRPLDDGDEMAFIISHR
ncbi:class I SAM-dependent methyltransferase [Vibrio salinus]|uniref:class I SAM-dependent methyltransferase n=1 Tax=Vibrio salinus TaxID=2899784 RepID=UPI001E548527|nr:class I SAM-dependent methyltransferase [Vibrio salinus]MCE0494878.1 class I SAM-dependent methyltransferase [Vibrio salinus]